MRRSLASITVVLLSALACGCGKRADASADAGSKQALHLEPDGIPDEVREQEPVNLAASIHDEKGAASPAPNVAWSVVPPDAGRIEASKLVPLREGSLEIVGVMKDARGESRCTKNVRVRSALLGQWERQLEPYKGLRISIQSAASGMTAVVVSPPAVTEERIAARAARASRATATAELECQRSAWHPREGYLSSIERSGKPTGPSTFTAHTVVRDWGLAPGCQHRDVPASAQLEVVDATTLTMRVTRAGARTPVEQRWSYVGP